MKRTFSLNITLLALITITTGCLKFSPAERTITSGGGVFLIEDIVTTLPTGEIYTAKVCGDGFVDLDESLALEVPTNEGDYIHIVKLDLSDDQDRTNFDLWSEEFGDSVAVCAFGMSAPQPIASECEDSENCDPDTSLFATSKLVLQSELTADHLKPSHRHPSSTPSSDTFIYFLISILAFVFLGHYFYWLKVNS
ncbi:MAG: hypothetical protein CL677_10485 [Bdellovibrionaceae bacterium]|nr:hypothetical protein [Pseudobdellovibrionaceae bacterium]|tara:strand:+ start:181192 stop:181776 length:585 start_codon:yes stop_codon:yes gene_type:complete